VGSGRTLTGTEPAGGEVAAAVRLHLTPGLGDRRGGRLLRELGSARGVVDHPERVEAVAGARVARSLTAPSLDREVEAVLRRCDALEIGLVPWADPRYPPPLREVHDPPPLLFFQGDLQRWKKRRVAVVGSRKATPTGRRTAERLGRDLSRVGVGVWSGLALGVDGAAHRGALEGGGGTVAVLGAGLDCPYPLAHRPLLQRIAREGLVFSEFPPGTRPRPHHFPRRNRILAAMAEAVIVVEATPGSGALITVDHAQDLGRPVLAVPGSVESEQSRGTNALIRDGAALVLEAQDVLDHLQWGTPSPDPAFLRPTSDSLTPCEARITALLGPVPLPLEEVLEHTGLPPSRVLAALTGLEIADRIRRVPEGWVLGPGGR